MRQLSNNRQGGYSIIELAAVMTILSIFLGLTLSAFARARRAQEMDQLTEETLDLVRRAKSAAISPDPGYRVYGVEFDLRDTGDDFIRFIRHPIGCPSSAICRTGYLIREVNLNSYRNARLEKIEVSRDAGGSFQAVTASAGRRRAIVYFSSPFARACVRLRTAPGGFGISRDYPLRVTAEVDKDYPIDWDNNHPSHNERHCNPEAAVSTLNYILRVTLKTNEVTLPIERSIQINMYSGDVSS